MTTKFFILTFFFCVCLFLVIGGLVDVFIVILFPFLITVYAELAPRL